MKILQGCGVALSLLVFLLQAKRSGGDTRGIVFGAALLFFSCALPSLGQILTFCRSELSGAAGYESLYKALGIGLVSQFTSEICRDAGEGVLAERVEFLAKVEIVLLSLPLIGQILSLAGQILP